MYGINAVSSEITSGNFYKISPALCTFSEVIVVANGSISIFESSNALPVNDLGPSTSTIVDMSTSATIYWDTVGNKNVTINNQQYQGTFKN